MHQMHISTNYVSSVMLRLKNMEIKNECKDPEKKTNSEKRAVYLAVGIYLTL
jgi:hypothetical protein